MFGISSIENSLQNDQESCVKKISENTLNTIFTIEKTFIVRAVLVYVLVD